MKVLRILGMVLMCLWILNGGGHVLLGLMGEGNFAFHVLGGIAQVALALWLLFKIHAWPLDAKAEPEVKTDGIP